MLKLEYIIVDSFCYKVIIFWNMMMMAFVMIKLLAVWHIFGISHLGVESNHLYFWLEIKSCFWRLLLEILNIVLTHIVLHVYTDIWLLLCVFIFHPYLELLMILSRSRNELIRVHNRSCIQWYVYFWSISLCV